MATISEGEQRLVQIDFESDESTTSSAVSDSLFKYKDRGDIQEARNSRGSGVVVVRVMLKVMG